MNLVLAFLAGTAVGAMFYGGLWLTVRRLLVARHPGLLMFASFSMRTLIALAAFLVVARGRWENALAMLAGFIVARVAIAVLVPAQGGKPRCT